MNSVHYRPMGQVVTYASLKLESEQPRKANPALQWLFLMVLILLAAPKTRMTIGPLPLYLIDVLNGLLLLYAIRKPPIKRLKPLSSLVTVYLIFVWAGELRGMIIYGAVLEPIYMIVQFSLGISLFFVVPKLVRTQNDVSLVLKAIVAGLIFTSLITIFYSFGPTRDLVMELFFSHNFFVPSAERLAQRTLQMAGIQDTLRGQSLIGTSTITTGFLGVMWAFSFLAAAWPGLQAQWRNAAIWASILTPLAMLATYGRAAWLTVIVIGSMAFFFGFARGRKNMLVLIAGLTMIVYQVGWQSDLFLVDMLVQKTQNFAENPYEAEHERLGSYIEPFYHLMENPSWLLIGAGRVGKKLSQRGDIEATLRDVAGLSNHSGFGMAYYCYGLIAAITHALIILFGLLLVRARLKNTPGNRYSLNKETWQVFFMGSIGMVLWWLPGHAMIGEGRGVILFFFFYGFLASINNLWSEQIGIRSRMSGLIDQKPDFKHSVAEKV